MKTEFMTSTQHDLMNSKPEVNVIHDTDWSDFDIVVFLNLNVSPKASDKDFAAAMHNLFANHIKFRIKATCLILFGQNLR